VARTRLPIGKAGEVRDSSNHKDCWALWLGRTWSRIHTNWDESWMLSSGYQSYGRSIL